MLDNFMTISSPRTGNYCTNLLHILLHLLLPVVAEDGGHEGALSQLSGGRPLLGPDHLLIAPDCVVFLETLVLHPESGNESPAGHVHRLGEEKS